MIKFSRFFLNYRLEILLVLTSSLISGVAVWYFVSNDLALANGDAIARLNIGRRFFDSITPGFAQLGYVWLPINHVLMIPLIGIDALWQSGLAGISISAASFIASSIVIFKLVENMVNRLAAFCAYILFVLNPNIIYLQSTPLTEMFFIFTSLTSIVFIIFWAQTKKLRMLILSAFFIFLSTLSRYDGWFFALLILVGVLCYELLTTRSKDKAEGTGILFGVLSFFGVTLWLLWNWAIFKNPFYFALGEYSAAGQQMDLLKQNLLPSYHNILSSFSHSLFSIQLLSGWSLIILGAFGFLLLAIRTFRAREYRNIFVLALSLPFFYYIVNLYTGNGVIFVPNLWPNLMHNIRYGIISLPFLIIAVAFVSARYRHLTLIIVLVVLSEYLSLVASGKVLTLNESLNGFAGRTQYTVQIEQGKWLGAHYDDGLILADVFKNDPVAFYSGIHLKNWLSNASPKDYAEALENPASKVRWIVIKKDDQVYQNFHDTSKLSSFEIVKQEGDISIYKLRENITISSN